MIWVKSCQGRGGEKEGGVGKSWREGGEEGVKEGGGGRRGARWPQCKPSWEMGKFCGFPR